MTINPTTIDALAGAALDELLELFGERLLGVMLVMDAHLTSLQLDEAAPAKMAVVRGTLSTLLTAFNSRLSVKQSDTFLVSADGDLLALSKVMRSLGLAIASVEDEDAA